MKVSLAWLNQYLADPVSAVDAADRLERQGFPIEDRQTRPDGDVVLDVEVTSNRGDCLSHLGIARELAAGTRTRLAPPDPNPTIRHDDPHATSGPGSRDAAGRSPENRAADVESSHNQETPRPARDRHGRTVKTADQTTGQNTERSLAALTRVDLDEPQLCATYTARVLRGVRVRPSPDWLVQRLEAVGLRPINNIVDVTNFVLHELGQPLHAFDLQRLRENRIVVRLARSGETVRTIDDDQHVLRDDMLVITDAERPVAVAGVMGGRDTEVDEQTQDVLLESAAFDPLQVRRTARALKLQSDSSYRFERGVDPALVERASLRAAELMLQVAGGRLIEGAIRVGRAVPEPRVVSLRPERCRQVLGFDLPDERILDPLDRLGLAPKRDDDRIACRVPTFRLDLEREIDLVEEVARLHGLEDVPSRPRLSIVATPEQPEVQARRRFAEILIAHGYHEAVTFSFVAREASLVFLPEGAQSVEVADERRKAEPVLRPSLLPSLLACRKSNQDAGNTDVKLFELAATWIRGREGVAEARRLGMIADVDPAGGGAEVALRGLRGALEELAELAVSGRLDVQPAERSIFEVGGEVRVDDAPIGSLGLLSREVMDRFDLQTQVVAAELSLEALERRFPPTFEAGPPPRFPSIDRDLSLVVDDPTVWAQIEKEVRQADPDRLERLTFVTTYRGKPIPRGKKSVTLRLSFRDPERTLRHEEVDEQVRRVTDRLAERLGAELRTA